jgi:hypothetical protein
MRHCWNRPCESASRHALVARFEDAQKDELFDDEDARHFTVYPINRITAGYVLDLLQAQHATVGVGVAQSWNHVSDALLTVYGGSPRSAQVFVQLAMR